MSALPNAPFADRHTEFFRALRAEAAQRRKEIAAAVTPPGVKRDAGWDWTPGDRVYFIADPPVVGTVAEVRRYGIAVHVDGTPDYETRIAQPEDLDWYTRAARV